MSDDWDVDSYKSEFENEEHWQLRRNFMLAHKDKFPEDQLVCLAQAFTNIEFMGCRYPDETMVRIAELAKGVVEKFREQRKNCLKRTFVAASDAASAKVKGRAGKQKESATSKRIKKIEKIEKNSKSTKEEIIKEGISTGVDISNLSGVKSMLMGQDKEPEVCSLSNLEDKTENFNLTQEERWKARLRNFVLILSSDNDNPIEVLQQSTAFNRFCFRWKFESNDNSSVTCKFFLNNRLIATGNGKNAKLSREQTAMAVVSKFQESHYAIKIKGEFLSGTAVTPAQLESGFEPNSSGSGSKQSSNELGEDNIGRKIMKLMGQKGGGLGCHEQGIKDPIIAPGQNTRKGLGNHKQNMKAPTAATVQKTKKGSGRSPLLASKQAQRMAFRKKAREFIRKWMKSNLNDRDLVFSRDFSSDERKIIHRAAKSLSLRSKGYGKASVRHLVVSRKFNPWDMVQELLKTGGSSKKYELIYPTKTQTQVGPF